MTVIKNKEEDLNSKKHRVNQAHIEFYDKILAILKFILDKYSGELKKSNMEFLDMPKNSVSTLDFLISAICKVQKGQRLALGLDEEMFENTLPVINIIEGLSEEKI